jgi:hypothetical protein
MRVSGDLAGFSLQEFSGCELRVIRSLFNGQAAEPSEGR